MADPEVVISQHGAGRLLAGHLWVYRSDIHSAAAEAGEVVRVVDERGRFFGRAFFSDRSEICVRVVTRDDVPVDRAFLTERIQRAARLRQPMIEGSRAYRLFYAESDQIPSLVIDRYGDYLVIQTLSQATERRKELLVDILVEIFAPLGILERNDPKVRQLEGLDQKVSLLYGNVPDEVIACEGELKIAYDLYHGQKTGGFLDQRQNRHAAARYARGEILDCFAGTGSFAVTLAPHAEHIEAIDLSPPALAGAGRNLELNHAENVSLREANAFDVLRAYDDAGRRFDTIVLDPPAFAKNKRNIVAACRGYKEINLRSLRLLRPEGFLITCSCSHHISEALFAQILGEASLDAHRHVAVVERRTQASDHPILLAMPETNYIKLFIMHVL
ncbi:MAG TPA: class I SAM-dependent rRNA methyltransferase [Candidatus Dormibacteraeota bacterium]|nr:class I SAM-dependent rRNA methyltransferase [Candidatus Dormibacteraeota bacterium]